MASVSYLYRRGARYYYRRRLHLRNLISRPITIALGTADPAQARRLGARLSVRWDTTMMVANLQVRRGYLTASEAVAVFKHGLDQELGLATAAGYDDGPEDVRTPRVFEAVYRIAARLEPDTSSISAGLLATHTSGFCEEDRRAVVLMLKAVAPQAKAVAEATQALASINAPVNGATIRDARIQILLAKAEAHARALLLEHVSI